jgi:hypothetical protein
MVTAPVVPVPQQAQAAPARVVPVPQQAQPAPARVALAVRVPLQVLVVPVPRVPVETVLLPA